MSVTKNCRVCHNDFEAPDPRRTLCDNCTDPEERVRNREYQRKRAKFVALWRPLEIAEAWAPELVELAKELSELGFVSTGSLTAAIRKLNAAQTRAGTRIGLIRVAAIAVGLARRLR